MCRDSWPQYLSPAVVTLRLFWLLITGSHFRNKILGGRSSRQTLVVLHQDGRLLWYYDEFGQRADGCIHLPVRHLTSAVWISHLETRLCSESANLRHGVCLTSTKSDPGFESGLIRILIRMSVQTLPKCCGFSNSLASVFSTSVVKICRWLYEKC